MFHLRNRFMDVDEIWYWERTVKAVGLNPILFSSFKHKQNKLLGFSPQANYTDRATAACRRS
jgi:hypothetical protein